MLINNGIFWDDWTIIGMERLGLEQQFGENGFWIMTYVHDILNDGKYAPMIYHWLSFFSLFLAYVFFYKILIQFYFKEETAFLIALLAMAMPYFEAKITAVCMPYSLFLCFFGMGVFLVFGFIEGKKSRIGLFTGILFLLLSFFLNSLLLLFLFLLGLYFLHRNNFSISQMKKNSLRVLLFYFCLALLPFIFWILKKTFFPIKGLYAAIGYNVINFSLDKLPTQYETIFTNNVIGLYREFIEVFTDNLFFGIVVFVICLGASIFILKSIKFSSSPKKMGLLLLVGTSLLFISTFPYTLVDKLPSFIGYSTRHQILLPAGVIFFVFVFVFVLPPLLRRGVYTMFLSIFMTMGINANLNFLRGWVKQEAIKQEIKELDINTSGVIFARGLNGKFNATERPLTFYELNGIFKETLKRQDLFIISKRSYNSLGKSVPLILTHAVKFNMRDVPNKVNEGNFLEITYLKKKIGHARTIGFVGLYFFNRNRFHLKIDEILEVSYKSAKQ